MDEVIRVKDLTKQFGDLQVLRGIDCAVTTSEVVCVIGPSGSGKSTLLRCLNGLEDATGGEVLVRGVSVHDHRTDVDALRSEIGMVFQRFNNLRADRHDRVERELRVLQHHRDASAAQCPALFRRTVEQVDAAEFEPLGCDKAFGRGQAQNGAAGLRLA